MKKGDWLLFIGFILIIASMMAFTYYAYTTNVNECTRDPLGYAVESLKESTDADYVFGDITVVKDSLPRTDYFGDEDNIFNIK